VAEIRTSVQYFRSSNAGQQIAQMSLTGGGAALRGVAALMEEQIGLPTRVGDPTQHLGNRESSEHLREGGSLSELSAVSVGLAMGAAA
jgi:type IV pilus assembly protein PilM